jgi:hypothetical protein
MTSEFDTPQGLIMFAKEYLARGDTERVDRALALLSRYVDRIHEFGHNVATGKAPRSKGGFPGNTPIIKSDHFLGIDKWAYEILREMERYSREAQQERDR